VTDYSGFRKSPDVIEWMRATPALHFVKQLEAKVVTAHENMVATCLKSSDPKVTAAVTLWHELATLTVFLKNARKDAVDGSD